MAHPNVEIMRKSDEAMAADDIEKFFSFFADDVVVHVGGSSALAGEYKGKEQMQQVFDRFMGAVGDYSFENHAYLADDEHGVTLQKSHYKRGDETLDTNEAFVCHFRDGKVSEFWFMSEDSQAVDAFLG